MSIRKLYAAIGITAALFVAIAPGSVELIKWVETNYFPVATEAIITQVDVIQDRPDSVVIWGTSRKLRDCRFERLNWYRGIRPIPSVRVEVKFEERDKIRRPAPFQFGPWRLFMTWDPPPAENPLTHTSFANAWHQCYVFGFSLPWLTKTRFYN